MEKTKFSSKSLSAIFCLVLVAAIALTTAGCKTGKGDTKAPSSQTVSDKEITELGKGENHFNFSVFDTESKETKFKISTDEKTVGKALINLKLIAGDEGAYGLYVKTVNNITLDFDKTGLYWAFYEGDDYAAQGVDTTEIKNGASYSFRMQK